MLLEIMWRVTLAPTDRDTYYTPTLNVKPTHTTLCWREVLRSMCLQVFIFSAVMLKFISQRLYYRDITNMNG